MRLDASACCVTGKVTSARRNVSQCADCGWLVDWPWGPGRLVGGNATRFAGNPQTSILTERTGREKTETHTESEDRHLPILFHVLSGVCIYFFLRQKCFRRCLGVCSWRSCVRWLPGLQTKTVRRLPPPLRQECKNRDDSWREQLKEFSFWFDLKSCILFFFEKKQNQKNEKKKLKNSVSIFWPTKLCLLGISDERNYFMCPG